MRRGHAGWVWSIGAVCAVAACAKRDAVDDGLVAPEAPNGGGTFGDGGRPAPPETGDAETCEEAARLKTYIGCDYWPTVLANNVWSIFDYAVVVANAGQSTADVTVTGPNGTNETASVPAGNLKTIYLPWVPALKGPDWDSHGTAVPLSSSVFAPGGAYHLVSTAPVTVYQFNALEYKGAGGPPGKSWDSCPAYEGGIPCESYSNDASLLLPSTAMTGNYRVAGIHGATAVNPTNGTRVDVLGAYFAVTGTADGTNVTVKVAAGGSVLGGGSIAATGPGGILTFKLDAGDVAEIVSDKGSSQDLSGSQVAADKPVQVLAGISCINIPADKPSCDHVEESVLPAETLGKHYVVTQPTGPNGVAVGHDVRIFGNVDGTKLTGLPASCPGGGTIHAGQVLDCGIVTEDFEVTGDHEFSVASFQQGQSVVDQAGSMTSRGDPSASQMIAVEQFRTRYIFLAPADYDVSFVDVVAPQGTELKLDGAAMSPAFTAVGSSGLAVARIQLGPGRQGAHVIKGDKPFGIQVIGYGAATSYQYPGGLDLRAIAPPPPPPR